MVSKKQALEIIGDPFAKEREWMNALAVVDYKVPSLRQKRLVAWAKRFARRYAITAAAYFSIFGIAALPDLLFFHEYYAISFTTMLWASLVWAGAERVAGMFTIMILMTLPTMFAYGAFTSGGLMAWSIFAVLAFNIWMIAKGWVPEVPRLAFDLARRINTPRAIEKHG